MDDVDASMYGANGRHWKLQLIVNFKLRNKILIHQYFSCVLTTFWKKTLKISPTFIFLDKTRTQSKSKFEKKYWKLKKKTFQKILATFSGSLQKHQETSKNPIKLPIKLTTPPIQAHLRKIRTRKIKRISNSKNSAIKIQFPKSDQKPIIEKKSSH